MPNGAENPPLPLRLAWQSHARRWEDFLYVYPVVSRRSGGLSIGVNLNPDKACNFDCIYCQVDRTLPPTLRKVDVEIVRAELDTLVSAAMNGALFRQPPFDAVPPENRRIRDVAFSGDGEPTTSPQFLDAVRIAADARQAHQLNDSKLVLITDACYLEKNDVQAALALLDDHNGEIWAKLDAGTQAYFELINRPNYPLAHVMRNITETARKRPIVIQSLWMNVHGAGPPPEEIRAYCDRLNEVLAAGGKIKLVQLYTIARRTTETYATALADGALDQIAEVVRARVAVPIAAFYGVGE